MTISVVIVSWNTRELLLAAVDSVLAQEVDAAVEVIVVDNGSTDGTVEALAESRPEVRLVRPGRNLGFAAGNNLGIRRSRGAYTLLLNPDTKVRQGALAELLRLARERPEVAAWQPLVILPDGAVQVSWHYSPTLLEELALVLYRGRWVYTPGYQAEVRSWREPREVKAVGLAALFVPRWVWRKIGLLATATFLYFEEADLSERLRSARLPMRLAPTAEVEHHIGQSTGQVPWLCRRAHYLSRMWFYETHRDRFSSAVVRWLSAARATCGIALAEWRRARGDPDARRAADELWRPVLAAARRASAEH